MGWWGYRPSRGKMDSMSPTKRTSKPHFQNHNRPLTLDDNPLGTVNKQTSQPKSAKSEEGNGVGHKSEGFSNTDSATRQEDTGSNPLSASATQRSDNGVKDFQTLDDVPEKLDRFGRPMPKTEHLVPYHYKKGQSGNPSGRQKDVVRAIGQQIAARKISKALKPKEREMAEQMGFDTSEITLLENLMLKLAMSANPMKVALFLERTFGKVPNININAEMDATLVARFRQKFTDSELQAIANGESPMDILFEKLPDIDESPMSDDMVDGSFINE